MGDRSRVTRAIVLARGAGTRMQRAGDGDDAGLTAAQRAAASAGHKALMPIGGRPFLDHVLAPMAEAGVTDVALVVAPDHDAMRAAYPNRTGPRGLHVSFVVQEQPLGTANAVWAARAWHDAHSGGDFFVCNGDNVYPHAAFLALAELPSAGEMSGGCGVAGFERDALVASSNIPADRIAAFAVIERAADGRLARIIEKPSSDVLAEMTPPILISMNLWRLDARVFDACRDVPISPRGEFELPNAVMLAMSRGVSFDVAPVSAGVLDLSSRADVSGVARRLEHHA